MQSMIKIYRLFEVRRSFLLPLSVHLVGINGLFVLATTMLNQIAIRRGSATVISDVNINILAGLSLIYLWSLLRRHKHNAWLVTMGVYLFTLGFNLSYISLHMSMHASLSLEIIKRIIVPLTIVGPLVYFRAAFDVRSDIRGFGQAVRVTLVLMTVTFLYGVSGFTLLDNKDFQTEINLPMAAQRTIDQFDLTTKFPLKPHTRRAMVFLDSLSVVSTASVAFVFISFFQPLRARYTHLRQSREEAEALLEIHKGTSEDFFKIWPHDKSYMFSADHKAGLAYKVERGVAIVVGDPFGDRKSAGPLLGQFEELCYTNDWLPAFVHSEPDWQSFYKQKGYTVQSIGEEAIVSTTDFVTNVSQNKYFRQIRNRFKKQLFTIELLMPPHNKAIIERLRAISDDWLTGPGRAERTFVMGYFSEGYLQQCPLMVARDGAGTISAFLNRVPSYDAEEANFDMLRHAKNSPGNINDFLLSEFIQQLAEEAVPRLNLGLCPLANIGETKNTSVITAAMRFMYANGDRFYSFKGLYRFKAKYEPTWSTRYVVYKNGVPGFTRTMRALSRAMKLRPLSK